LKLRRRGRRWSAVKTARRHQLYRVSAEVDHGDGGSRFGDVKNIGATDSDNQIPFDAVAQGSDT
jgi:hypothetical protein